MVIIKNEGSYLVEWLEFHRIVGIEHVYLYDNGRTDDTKEILAPYLEDGYVTWIPWISFDQNAVPQYQSYAHALCNFGPSWRWMAFIDLDEFLFALQHDGLKKVLSDYEDLPAIAVHWHMFGSSGHKHRPPGLVIESYTQRAAIPPAAHPKKLLKWKSIVDPTKIKAVFGSHFFMLDDGRIGAYDEERRWISNPQLVKGASKILRLNHYYTKSEEELAIKISKGGIGNLTRNNSHPRAPVGDIAKSIERVTVRDEAILRFVAPLRKRIAAAQLHTAVAQ